MPNRILLTACVVAIFHTMPAHAQGDSPELIARGAYLAQIMDCAGCHMPRGPDGAPIFEAGLSGGTIGFEMPGLGIFWPSNLTPDSSGLGDWTSEQIARAITSGVHPDGRVLAPVMPWPNYAALTEEDLAALVTWLESRPPVGNAVPPPVAPGSSAPAPYFRIVGPGN